MSGEQIALNDILGEGLELARQHSTLLAATGVAIAVGYTVLDVIGASGAATAVNLVVAVMVQYQVLEKLLADRITPEGKGKRRYLSLFGSSLLSGLGIGLGFVLLIIPGIYLSGRWLSCTAYVVAEGKRSSESLSASWSASEPSQVAHALAALVSGLPIVGLIISGVVAVSAGVDVEGLAASAMINVFTAASSLLIWVLGAAAYRVQRPGNAQLDAVFA